MAAYREYPDDELMSPQQRALLLEVLTALDAGETDVYRAVATRMTPPPPPEHVDSVLRILDIEAIRYRPGEPGAVVLSRILDALEAAANGVEFKLPPDDDID
ncbi:hypothetical protein OIE68_45460 [Nocardia vinacea]|uniref:hypothetical protein n=1 Tax=Nocardia vinacea TaxID=96468 RepID=UPI002E0D691F|nr:hypothetical protein OIE68_45460 [Nocardia vinacea]